VWYRPADIDVEIYKEFNTESEYAEWISECIDSVWVARTEGLD
jgi:hypothetical protein